MAQTKVISTADLARELGVRSTLVLQAIKMCLANKPHIIRKQYRLDEEEAEIVRDYVQKYLVHRQSAIRAKDGWGYTQNEEKPEKAGLYLCYRLWNGKKIYELIHWSGEYWLTGGGLEDKILAWHKMPREPRIK